MSSTSVSVQDSEMCNEVKSTICEAGSIFSAGECKAVWDTIHCDSVFCKIFDNNLKRKMLPLRC